MVEQPTVNLRFPIAPLVWPIMFTTSLVLFISWVIGNGLAKDPSVTMSDLFVALFVEVMFAGVPLAMVVAMARSSVRSLGTTLRVRSGLITRMLPAADIDGFLTVDRVGHRADCRMCRVATALRQDSPSDRRDRWSDRSPWARQLRRLSFVLTNRRPSDIPLGCVGPSLFSRRRVDEALVQLRAWHEGALGGDPPAARREPFPSDPPGRFQTDR
jgi:hypothetical protein